MLADCRLITLIGLGVLLAACRPSHEAPGDGALTVLAAASLTDVVSDLARRHETATGTTVRCSFASSSTLARQIEAGAGADVFISADAEWMERLDAAGLLDAPSIEVAGNRLVVVTHGPGSDHPPVDPLDADDLASIEGRIAVGDPAHVPAGRYARAALEHLGVWEDVEPRLVAAIDVRAALRLAEMNAVDAAIVYATDAAGSERVSVLGLFAADAHPPIRYPAAALRGAGDGARRFVAALGGPDAQARFADAGFAPSERVP